MLYCKFRCESCDETREAFAKIVKEWEDHPIGFVAEVYCDSEDGELICEGYEVSGYPSVYYGDPESPELYRGSLEYESLSSFAKDNISTLPCSVKNLDACDSKTEKLIKKLQEKTQENLEEIEKQVLKQVQEEQTRFDKAALKLQQQYTDLADNFNRKIDKLRDGSGFKWVQQLLNEMETENGEDGKGPDSEL